MLPLLTEVTTMAAKKSSSAAKNSKNALKRHPKLAVPKGEKVSSMKGTDFSITKHIDKASPVLFQP
jgi:type VI protein secretion system component Hcp